ncbi:type I restriction endonuclease subunit R [Chamaesiphon minutus]|uniref:Type I restriction enzyme endonuclease subunit n=1 Tax=Chamaesiphon minutus (strain ATCC 27169 / PCC 6605) TaxID=1173020 RepID=K9UAY7_CHAP6|nr:type I restriction endonuclease subunit R [Chamaesiphon minutus]AFY91773.1 type I site-specific deoxyribonuclease, HsdR family [Chamaesiphon minutus PCC 6605]
MTPSPIDLREVISSQIPALALIQNIGYTYITPAEALAHRQGKRSKVVLEDILTAQLHKLNQIDRSGKIHPFSDANIQTAVAAISQFPYDALYTTSAQIYDLLVLGKSLEQTIDGDKKSHQLKYIDWENPSNNSYHVTDEFEVERLNSTQTRRPDIVVFVNGIPLVAIECKRPDLPKATEEAISQHLRNQRTDEIPHFFCVTQILMAIAQNSAQYATTGTSKEFWAVWKEEGGLDKFEAELYALINVDLSATQSQKLLSWRQTWEQVKIRELWAAGERLVSAQDRLIYSLLAPQRLLALIHGYILFDAGDKKIARYQQYFAVRATIDRVKQVRGDKSRQGGVIWHTTGSGKSLTMVLLAKALIREPSILNPKIILVNDRVDLDDQLTITFGNCKLPPTQAQSGKNLLELLNLPKAEIITTVIDKFDTVAREKGENPSPNIFVLVDESHRSQYGQIHAKMRNVFPHACYIGFTGTPLLKKDKSTAQKFGGFIHSYTMPKAVGDKAVVPIVYEGRESEFKNTEAVDKWFDRITSDLNSEQKADLKRKFKSAEPLYEADARMREVAYDLSQHFDKHFKGTKLKGQFATSSKRAAITYKKLLDDWGKVRSAVIISPPDTREDNDSVNEADLSEVQRFWKDMMAIYGTPKNYQDRLIEKFKDGDGDDAPDLLIVVDKLLTGFDAPRNAILYIDKRLKEHNILQAIARVNRVFEGKEYGLVIDYRGIFGEMNQALEIYAALEQEGFDREDIEGALVDVRVEIAKLPTLHAAVWDVFKGVTNLQDTESLQQWLEPQDRRDEFYAALRDFAKNLRLALSNAPFQADTPETTKHRYLQDLKSWLKLRDLVKVRYGEKVDYSEYTDQIRRMVEKEIGASEFMTIIEPVDIFDLDRSNAEIESIVGTAAQADAIAARIKKVAIERMEEDPVLYLRLSQLIQTAIDAHRAKRLGDIEYLQQMRSCLETVRSGGADTVPLPLQTRPQARAFYNVLQAKLSSSPESLETEVSARDAKSAYADYNTARSVVREVKSTYTTQSAQADFAAPASILIDGGIDSNINHSDVFVLLSIGIEDIITKHKVRDWQHHKDIQNRMMNEIDDLVHDLKKTHNLFIHWADLDELIAKILKIAENYEVS